jgi:UPF0755 protein
VDDEPRRLTVSTGEERAPGEPAPPRRQGPAHLLPVLIGILIGAAAIAVSVIVLRGNGSEAAAPPPPPTVAPPQPALRIVFPEGFTREDMADRIVAVNEIAEERRGITPALSGRDYLAATRRSKLKASHSQLPPEFAADKNVKSFEGFLFPATYEFREETASPELVAEQLKAFTNSWSEIDLTYAKSRNLTAYDVLIIASMIEGEVQVARERPLVAAVIYNRLKARMPLGIDATLRYGLDIPPNRAIRQSELEHRTPYNTRIHRGLPPTPIGNPGLASMQAAAHPAEVDYLFFARKKDCKSHFFTKSDKKFLEFLEGPRC